MVYRKSKTNTTFFSDIEKKDKNKDIREDIFKLLKEKSNIRAKREVLKEQQIDTRKTIYNLSINIEKIEKEIEDLIMRGGF